MNFSLFLVLISGMVWVFVYIDSIRIGLKEKTYAMPFWALALNFAWEALHTIIGYRVWGLYLQLYINAVWALIDIGILYTYFRFGRKYYPKNFPPSWFQIWGVLGLVIAFLIQYLFINEFGLAIGATYAAFLQNLLMSILFIKMLIQRKSSEGQTLLIGVSKWVGTLAPTILFGAVGVSGGGTTIPPSSFILGIGMLISLFDLIYIGLLAKLKMSRPFTT